MRVYAQIDNIRQFPAAECQISVNFRALKQCDDI